MIQKKDFGNFFWTANTDYTLDTLGQISLEELQFSVAPVTELFQKILNELVIGIKGVEVIADDFPIYGEGSDAREAIYNHYKDF